jgi:hypothetical protein
MCGLLLVYLPAVIPSSRLVKAPSNIEFWEQLIEKISYGTIRNSG